MYQFKQAVRLCDQVFTLGTHEVSEKVENHPYFLKMVEAGLVVDIDEQKVVVQVSPQERSKKLYDRLTGKTAPKVETKVEAPAKVDAPKEKKRKGE